MSPVIADPMQDAGVLPAEWTVATPPAREVDTPYRHIGHVSDTFVPVRRFGPTRPTKAQIRDRAYFIYLARDGAPGDPAADWTQAERELEAEFRATFERSRHADNA